MKRFQTTPRFFGTTRNPEPQRLMNMNKLDGVLNSPLRHVDEVGWIAKSKLPLNSRWANHFSTLDQLDYSNRCLEIMQSVSTTGPDPIRRSMDYEYIFVGGLWSNYASSLYFRSSQKRMEQIGLSFTRAVLNTSAGVDQNAGSLKKLLEEKILQHASRKIIFIGHSKGGLDTLSMLLKYPHLQKHVEGLITMQSPLGGSPLANDFLSSSSLLRNIVATLFNAQEGNALKDLTYEERRQFYQCYPLTQLDVPMLNFATSCDANDLTLLTELYNYMADHYSHLNDGMVLKDDAIIPGYPFVHLEGVTHLGPVFGRIAGSKYLPGDITISLLKILLEDILSE